MIWKSHRKEIFYIFCSPVIRKNRKQGTTEINFLSMFKLQITNLLFVCWQIFNRTLWLQNIRKIKYKVRYKLYYFITGWKKKYSFFLNIFTLHIIQKVFHYWSFFNKRLWSKGLPEKWFGNKYDIFQNQMCFPVHNISEWIIFRSSNYAKLFKIK